jgi:hypothetical protein
MDDLSGAIALVAIIDLAIFAVGVGVLVAWFRLSRPSAAALGGAWAGFLGGYVVFFGWAFVPTGQILRTALLAVVVGVMTGVAVWLVFSSIAWVLERRRPD